MQIGAHVDDAARPWFLMSRSCQMDWLGVTSRALSPDFTVIP